MTQTWGSQLLLTENEASSTSIVILNGFHFGLFLYEGMIERVVESVYDLRIFISNISLVWLLFRWMVALIALLNGYRQEVSDLDAANVGVLSCCRGFYFLPVVLLPHLKMYLAIFSTIGCQFEGAQRALSETRTVMYPGIAELVLFSYSILNLLAKALRQQVSDALFAPALLFYCLMHTLRQDLAESGWLEYQGRVTTIVTSSEFAALPVVDFFQSDMVLRLNGNIKSLLWIKVAVYAASILLPLLWSRRQQLVADDTQVTQLERALGLHLDASGGLTSELFRTCALNRSKDSNSGKVCLRTGYELVRLGYVVFGDDCLISLHDWYAVFFMGPTRFLRFPSGPMHVLVFQVIRDATNGCYEVKRKPKFCRLNDEQLLKHPCWQISVGPFH